MLIVRFRQSFRERAMEWSTAAGLLGWGLILSMPEPRFERPFYQPLEHIMPEHVWAMISTVIGVMSLTALFINGAWRRTPFLRQIGCIFRMFVWGGLFWGAMSVEWRSPGAAIYAMLFLMDAISLSFAAGDGRMAVKPQTSGAGYGHC
jgi:hypothetical protein